MRVFSLLYYTFPFAFYAKAEGIRGRNGPVDRYTLACVTEGGLMLLPVARAGHGSALLCLLSERLFR